MVPFECWNDNCYYTRIRLMACKRPNYHRNHDTRTEHVFKGTNRSLSLTVGLRMECDTQIKRSTESRLKCFPQSRVKPSITVRDDVARRLIITNDLIGVDSG
ncbi:hypothetical protein HanPI659440_Chr04g0167531 [Helianthus annuus]|nr:hypothetical protein HanPI659440_Chr04g0167531 [Helianthus annuus]